MMKIIIRLIVMFFLFSIACAIIGKPSYQVVIMHNVTFCHRTKNGSFKIESHKTHFISSYLSPFGESISLFGPGESGKVAVLPGNYAILDKGDAGDEYMVDYVSGDKYIITDDIRPLPAHCPFIFMRYYPC